MAKEKRTRTLYESELGKAAAYEPTRAPEAEPFWRGCRERQLVLPWCTACERFHFYPRPFCPSCDSTAIEWRAVSGKGTVYTFAVVRQPIEEAFCLSGSLCSRHRGAGGGGTPAIPVDRRRPGRGALRHGGSGSVRGRIRTPDPSLFEPARTSREDT